MTSVYISERRALKLYETLQMQKQGIAFKIWYYSLNKEARHNNISFKHDDPEDELTRIALVTLKHLIEFPDYYEQLDKFIEHLRKKNLRERRKSTMY